MAVTAITNPKENARQVRDRQPWVGRGAANGIMRVKSLRSQQRIKDIARWGVPGVPAKVQIGRNAMPGNADRLDRESLALVAKEREEIFRNAEIEIRAFSGRGVLY